MKYTNLLVQLPFASALIFSSWVNCDLHEEHYSPTRHEGDITGSDKFSELLHYEDQQATRDARSTINQISDSTSTDRNSEHSQVYLIEDDKNRDVRAQPEQEKNQVQQSEHLRHRRHHGHDHSEHHKHSSHPLQRYSYQRMQQRQEDQDGVDIQRDFNQPLLLPVAVAPENNTQSQPCVASNKLNQAQNQLQETNENCNWNRENNANLCANQNQVIRKSLVQINGDDFSGSDSGVQVLKNGLKNLLTQAMNLLSNVSSSSSCSPNDFLTTLMQRINTLINDPRINELGLQQEIILVRNLIQYLTSLSNGSSKVTSSQGVQTLRSNSGNPSLSTTEKYKMSTGRQVRIGNTFVTANIKSSTDDFQQNLKELNEILKEIEYLISQLEVSSTQPQSSVRSTNQNMLDANSEELPRDLSETLTNLIKNLTKSLNDLLKPVIHSPKLIQSSQRSSGITNSQIFKSNDISSSLFERKPSTRSALPKTTQQMLDFLPSNLNSVNSLMQSIIKNLNSNGILCNVTTKDVFSFIKLIIDYLSSVTNTPPTSSSQLTNLTSSLSQGDSNSPAIKNFYNYKTSNYNKDVIETNCASNSLSSRSAISGCQNSVDCAAEESRLQNDCLNEDSNELNDLPSSPNNGGAVSQKLLNLHPASNIRYLNSNQCTDALNPPVQSNHEGNLSNMPINCPSSADGSQIPPNTVQNVPEQRDWSCSKPSQNSQRNNIQDMGVNIVRLCAPNSGSTSNPVATQSDASLIGNYDGLDANSLLDVYPILNQVSRFSVRKSMTAPPRAV